MKNFSLSLMAAIAAALTATASAQDLNPDIIFPQHGNDFRLMGMSDNGKWAVQGSSIVDITANPFVYKEIGGSVRDISDDGKTAVGSQRGMPAVWREGKGWQTLPIPAGSRGGSVNKLTPDGRYGVGQVSLGSVNSSDGCLWDLETLSMIEMPGRPLEDRAFKTNDPNGFQNQYDHISSDGRYVQGILSYSYVGWQTPYIYDRQTGETHYIGYKKDANGDFTPDDPWIHYTECEGMSGDGHYVTGPVYITKGEEYVTSYRYDVWNDKFEYWDKGDQADSWGFSVSDDGVVYLRKAAWSPYSDGFICYKDFFYAFGDILRIEYGIDLERYNIDNTGVPNLCSADGRTFQFINSPSSAYVVRFKEDLKDVCERVNLLSRWTASPADGSVMSRISSIKIDFTYPIECNPDDYKKVEILDSEGNVVANALSGGGISTKNNTLTVSFRSYAMEPGKEYTVRIPAGICYIADLPTKTNSEIRLRYKGRKEGPVAITSIFPADGSTISRLDLQESPLLVTFDASLKLNTALEEPVYVYIDDEEEPATNCLAGLYNQNTLALFPPNAFPLYKGSSYTVKVPAGVVTDISGAGASEAFEVRYNGSYVPQLGDAKYLFKSSCDNWDNFLFYEGDHGTPVAEYAEMGFTADTTPWWVVMDNPNSTDMAFASHSCYTDGRQADDWVVTRQILIPDETAYLAFDGQSYRRMKQDVLKIYVYVYDGMMNSLNAATVEQIKEKGDLVFEEALDPGATEGGIDGEWTHYAVSLEKYAGKNIYIAFVNQNRTQSLVMIDNVEVGRNIDAAITLTNKSNVVRQKDIEIKGFLTIASELDTYSSVNMTLLDGEGNDVSTISQSGLDLKSGDSFAFAFPEKLPLTIGEQQEFTIQYSLDDRKDSYSGSIRNLTFEPVKRVVLEEFTGRDCQFCPQGHAMIERLMEMFPNNILPICLYCYNGSDPKGSSVMDYWSYLGLTAAPSGRVNRRETTMSLFYSSLLDRYVYSGAQLPEGESATLWYDEVATELAEPASFEVWVEEMPSSGSSTLKYSAGIRSAIHLEDQNLNVFGVLLENGLVDYQSNGLYDTDDPLLGEWGRGGSLGSSLAYSTFDHAAKATWGRSFNGTANLIPSVLEADEVYTFDIAMPIPSSVIDPSNCEFVVMVIDGSTGRIVNAASTSDSTGVEKTEAENDQFEISLEGDNLIITSSEPTEVQVFSPSGILLTTASGEGRFTVNVAGYRGPVIVRVATSGAVTSSKFLIR